MVYYYYLFLLFIYSVNIKPPRHRFGFSLCLGLAKLMTKILEYVDEHYLQGGVTHYLGIKCGMANRVQAAKM